MPRARPPRARAAWWSPGLRFSCTQCGKCCEARGEYQWVYVNAAERARLAAFLGLEEQTFLDRFSCLDPDGYRSLRFVEGRCVFLEGTRCRVHPVKPVQCRTWPFWGELLESPRSWREEVLAYCPGSGRGTRIPASEIAERIAETRAAEEADESRTR